jgi:hypothetical protein
MGELTCNVEQSMSGTLQMSITSSHHHHHHHIIITIISICSSTQSTAQPHGNKALSRLLVEFGFGDVQLSGRVISVTSCLHAFVAHVSIVPAVLPRLCICPSVSPLHRGLRFWQKW